MLENLNPVQREAVEYIDGPSLVIAGAGSGKTRVLTFKIAHLIKSGIEPYRILALTFTNKAAEEMKERINSLLGYNVSRDLWMGTFHSIFGKILRFEAEALGYDKNFTIYDSLDSKNLIKSLIKEMNLNDEYYKVKYIQSRISAAKNNLMTPQAYAQNTGLLQEDKENRIDKFVDLYLTYCQRCHKSNVMDFDDLLLKINILFKKRKDLLAKYQDKFDFILVDEYQDTNFAQYLIVKNLCGHQQKLCVVGDDAQSIYSFRGAQIKNILNFKDDFPTYRLFKLEQNYRSTKNIVNAASSVIHRNKEQIKKTLFSNNATGSKIKISRISTSNVEGYHVAQKIADLKKEHNYSDNDFAILYRTNAQSRVMEDALRQYNIGYKVYGGLSFYQRKEIKDILAYLRLAVNKNDTEAIRRVINYPSRKIGDTTMNKVYNFSQNTGISVWDIISKPGSYNIGVNQPTVARLSSFAHLIIEFSHQMDNMDAYELTLEVINKSGLHNELFLDKSPESVSRFENLQEFANGVKDFVEKRKKEFPDIKPSLTDFLENIALFTDLEESEEEKNKPAVKLMTIHSAKGLEFKNVFIVGLEENLFPGIMSTFSLADLEEERRLFYVAMTRAEENLFISHCDNRYKFGSMDSARPSRFIKDIDPQYIEFESSDNDSEDDSFESERNNYGSTTKKADYQKNTDSTYPKKKQKLVSLNNVAQSDNSSSNNSGLVIGSRVKHNSFGEGKVISISNEGGNSKAVIFFETEGNKTLLLKFAKLEILD